MRNALPALLLVLASCTALFSSSDPTSGDDGGDEAALCEESSCVANGGTCNAANVCTMSCASDASCLCPAGVNCVMRPSDESSGIVFDCSQGLDCSFSCGDDECGEAEFLCGTGSCDIACIGAFTCLGSSTFCGTSSCALDCAGLGACQDLATLDCGDAQACELDCRSDACTGFNARCSRAQSCAFSCTSGTHTCNGANFDCGDSPDCDRNCPDDNTEPCSS